MTWEKSRRDAADITHTETQNESVSLVTDLFEQYHTAIFAYLYRLTEDREWAHDLTQETFLKVFRARRQLPHVENRRAWVYRIATNTALNALKRHRRFSWLPWHQADLTVMGQGEQSDNRITIEQALVQLAPHYRAPLLLYSHYDLSVREVAEALEISEGAVKTRLHRARELFRRAFAGGSEE